MSRKRMTKASTALVKRRPKPTPTPDSGISLSRTLTDAIELGSIGLVEVKLTETEEAILKRTIPVEDVQLKPTGQVYLSHPAYTRWFNEAFGRLGWTIVPASKPMLSNGSVVCPYLLYIHARPAAFAIGEQTYHETNRDQTYGDALEATVASALRRCAKRLGMGLELWDKRWGDRFVATHGVKVVIVRNDRKLYAWRLKSDPPFWNEVTGGTVNPTEPEPAQRRAAPRPAHYDGHGTAAISEAQRKRLWVLIKQSGRGEREIKEWLWARYHWHSTKQITRATYDEICAAVESRSDLPYREPGEEP